MTPVLISLNDACKLTSLSRTGILQLTEVGDFPGRVPLYGRRFGFVRSEVLEWSENRIKRRATSPTVGDATHAA